MRSEIWLGRIVVSVVLSGVLAVPAGAQLYVGPGAVVLDQARVPYPYPYALSAPGPYLHGYVPPFGPWYVFPSVPPPSRYVAPSYSYNVNPYSQFPNSFSYEVPPYTYAPNSFTYDLRAYGYPQGGYSPPSYPYGYYYYYYYYYPGSHYSAPRYRRGIYRSMPLREYLARQFRGPVRVRDIVPGVPELGGWTRRP